MSKSPLRVLAPRGGPHLRGQRRRRRPRPRRPFPPSGTLPRPTPAPPGSTPIRTAPSGSPSRPRTSSRTSFRDQHPQRVGLSLGRHLHRRHRRRRPGPRGFHHAAAGQRAAQHRHAGRPQHQRFPPAGHSPTARPPARSSSTIRARFFTEYYTNRIARLDPGTNTLTEWVIPSANSFPEDIVVARTAAFISPRMASTRSASSTPPQAPSGSGWPPPRAPISIG